jgi:hypothetical protein
MTPPSMSIIIIMMLLYCSMKIPTSTAFLGVVKNPTIIRQQSNIVSNKNLVFYNEKSHKEQEIVKSSSSYENSDASSKSIVSTLTGLVNFIMGENKNEMDVRNNNNNNNNNGMFYFLFMWFIMILHDLNLLSMMY